MYLNTDKSFTTGIDYNRKQVKEPGKSLDIYSESGYDEFLRVDSWRFNQQNLQGRQIPLDMLVDDITTTTVLNNIGGLTATQQSQLTAAFNHITADGSSHTFINQSVITGSSPIFNGVNITGVKASNVTIVDAGEYYSSDNVEGALQEIANGTTLDDRYVNVTGDTMTGGLYIDGSSDEIQLQIDAHSTQTSEIIRINGSSQSTSISYIAGADARTSTFNIGENDISKGFIQYDGTPNTLIIGTNDNGNIYDHLTLKRSGELVVNEDGLSALDFRVETDNVTNAFFIDAGDEQVEINVGQIVNRTTVNASTYNLLNTDYILHVTYTSTGTCTITLPTAQVVDGRVIVVKDAGGNASANNITIDTQGSETIDGSATAVISGNYDSINIYSDGNNWFIF